MKILFAEDNDLLRKSLSYFLGSNGYLVSQCNNGRDAIETLKNNIYDLIITDINMPQIGGMEIINIVRNEYHLNTPIIVLTSCGVEKTELDAFDIGASEFISKPFSPSVLKARIEKLLKQPILEN
jgi:two-component system response regulator Irr